MKGNNGEITAALAALFEGGSPDEVIPRLPAGKTLSMDVVGGLVVVHGT